MTHAHPFSHRNKHSLGNYSNQIDLFKFMYLHCAQRNIIALL